MIKIGSKYEPIIKGPGFCPNPVAVYGIPDYADSEINPHVEGTIAHEDYWNEQVDRCLNGYTTGGIFIPGRYYYYLNFCLISTPKRGEHLPEFVDLDLEFFNLVEHVKKEKQGIISLKRRRAGVSFKVAHGVFGYGLRFNANAYHGGVVAGLSDYADDFYDKFKETNSRVPPELRLNTLTKSADEWLAGYEYNENGLWLRDGSFNSVSVKTANKNANVFKGKALDDCGFEEGGEFDNLLQTYNATEACFMAEKGRMVGTPYVWGTAGDLKAASKDFKAMLADADTYKLVPFDILGDRIMVGFFVGSINSDNQSEETVPNIMEKYGDLSREQILGCEDTEATIDHVLKNRKRLAKGTDKTKYYEDFRNFPLNRKEAFLNFTANPFNPDILADKLTELMELKTPRYRKVKLEWKRDKNGKKLDPPEVEIVLAKDEDEEKDCVLMLAGENPEPNYKNLDIAGGDGYDLDQSATSKSLGAFVIVRRRDMVTGRRCRKPILLIRTRPARKEIFYDNCLKAAVLFNLRKNVLFDIASPLVIEHFKANGGEKFLAERPLSFESKDSTQSHKYGVKLTQQNKPQMVAMMQTWVQDEAEYCEFPQILAEIADYDAITLDSDNDAADALGFALMRDVDMKRVPVDNRAEEEINKAFDCPIWTEREDGSMVDITEPEILNTFAGHYEPDDYVGEF
jgi:hypothetical protein